MRKEKPWNVVSFFVYRDESYEYICMAHEMVIKGEAAFVSFRQGFGRCNPRLRKRNRRMVVVLPANCYSTCDNENKTIEKESILL